MATMSLVTVQTWRSCTAVTPGTAEHPVAALPPSRRGPGTDLEQDIGALAQQPPGSDQDQQCESNGNDRVGQGPAGERDDRGGGERADRPEGVTQDVEVGAPGVEASIRDAVEERRG